jgi:putative transposase
VRCAWAPFREIVMRWILGIESPVGESGGGGRAAAHFLTFWLADALSEPWTPALDPWTVDQILDQGHGACALTRAPLAEMVEGALTHFDGDRYELAAWTVMPNHVHALVRPQAPWSCAAILRAWKLYTAHIAAARFGEPAPFWHSAHLDVPIAGQGHERRASSYLRAQSGFFGV